MEHSSTLDKVHFQVMQALLTELKRRGFSYISVLPEGFQECHDVAISKQLMLEDHPRSVGPAKNCLHNACVYHCNTRKKRS